MLNTIMLVLWVIVGGLQFMGCVGKERCPWFQYWCTYIMMMTLLIAKVMLHG